MSASIVHKRHIDAILSYARKNCPGALNAFSSISIAGQCLWDKNTRSVNYRYSTHDAPPTYKFTPYTPTLSAAQALKALHCLDYQCCEVDDHPKNYQDLYDDIHAEACRNVIGYEEAQWEITE